MTDQRWTEKNMPDLTGKIVIVTGANSGIGLEAAKEFARKGADTILACRSMDKANKALADLKRELPDAKVKVMHLDLASLNSVNQFVQAFQREYDRLDVLVNNAGIMMVPLGTTEDGFERQLGTNHLGHFALTGLLMPCLKNSQNARIVNVSSLAHDNGEMDFDDLMYTAEGTEYSPMKAYGRSKLANLLFTYELQRRLEAHDIDAIAVAAHPGISQTNLANHLFDRWYLKPLRPLFLLFLQSGKMGALPTLRAAVDAEVKGGSYYGPDGRGERRGFPVVVQSNRASHDVNDAQKLWQISEELTKIAYL